MQAAAYALRISVYFDWVASKSNWSDGISRDGFRDEWFPRHAFRAGWASVHLSLLALPLRAQVLVFEFL